MLIIRGGLVLTLEPELPIIKNGAVAVEGADIIAVAPFEELRIRYPQAKTIGSKGHWVLPGFVNAHSHCGAVSGYFRQGVLDLPLERWLMRLYNSCLPEGQTELAYLNTQYYCSQLIKSGVTSTADLHYCHGEDLYLGADKSL